MKRPFRVQLAGSYNTRTSSVNTLDNSSGFVGAGIVGIMIVGNVGGITNKDQRFLNCFNQTTVDAVTGVKTVKCVKRPGWSAANTPASGSIGTAITVWTGQGAGTKVISAFGPTNSTIYDGTTSLGAITGKATSITETFIGTTATLAIVSSDSTGWYYDVATGSATKISDADFPGNASKTLVGGFAHLDGFPCVMDNTGVLWAGDLNSITAWTATSFASANASPDRGIGCIRYKNLIMCFGTSSVEFFYNAGLTPFPLAKNTAMALAVGAVSAAAITQLDENSAYWVGSSSTGGLSVYKYDGSLTKISTPDIDTNLLLSGAVNINLSCYRAYGRSFIVVQGTNTTFCYCVEQNEWFEMSSSVVPWYRTAALSVGSAMTTYGISNVLGSGKVYSISPPALVYTDDGLAYTARAQADPMFEGLSNHVAWEELNILADKESSTSTLTVSYSDDDCNNFTTFGSVDLSTSSPRLTRLGMSGNRGRVWAFTHASATPMGIKLLSGRVDIGK